MTSDKKRSANKRNAQGSTGPSSVEGKAASRMNALKTGLYAKSLVIRGESREEFDELVQQFNDQYHPVTPQARLLVDILIRNCWLLRRYDRIDGEEWAAKHTKVDNFRHTDKSQPTALAFEMGGGIYARVRRFADTAERSVIRTLNQLDKLTEYLPNFKEAVATAEDTPAGAEEAPVGVEDAAPVPTVVEDSVPQPVDPEPPSTEVGFVPQETLPSSPQPPAPAPSPSSSVPPGNDLCWNVREP